MNRLTRKIMGRVELPTIPIEINSREDLEKFHKVRKEYEAMAIKLAEYEDRFENNNNCKYCCGTVDDRDYLLSDGHNGVYISGNGELVCDDVFDFEDKKVKYCPVCGRKL